MFLSDIREVRYSARDIRLRIALSTLVIIVFGFWIFDRTLNSFFLSLLCGPPVAYYLFCNLYVLIFSSNKTIIAIGPNGFKDLRLMAHETREQFRILFLDKRNVLIADEVQGRGTVDHTPVYPREVVKRALELSATAMILVHNHPSGDPTPSRADIDMADAFYLHCTIGRFSPI